MATRPVAHEQLGLDGIAPSFVGQLISVQDVMRFMLAGRATITLRSKKSGERFTYKVNKKDGRDFWFVSLLTGSDNESDFTYLGTMNMSQVPRFGPRVLIFTHGRKSTIGRDAPSSRGFEWFIDHLSEIDPNASARMFDRLEIWHEGRCGRCNRKLTVPESVATGFGPECKNHVGL